MAPSYRLDEEPWLPVKWLGTEGGGAAAERPGRVGLRVLLKRAHHIADLELALPPAASGIWRILALIAARVTELDAADGTAEWKKRRLEVLRAGRFDAGLVDDYFDDLSGAFDIFGGWLQDLRLAEQCSGTSGINKLCWGRTAGNNQVWLGGHSTDLAPEPVSPDIAAQHLIATMYHGPSGRCTARTAGGVSKADTSAGPLRGALSFHPLADDLFTTLVLNIPYPGDGEVDLAPWERDGPDDPTGLPAEATGLAGVLTNQYRHAVLLHPSEDGKEVVDATITWGFRITKEFRESWAPPTDPYRIYQTSKEGRLYARPADADRAVWRDLDALLRDNDRAGRRRPALFDNWTVRDGVPEEVLRTLRVRVFGFDQDGQTRDRQWFTATTPAVLRWLESSTAGSAEADRARQRIRLSVASAEGAGSRLESALKAAWRESNSPSGGEPKKTDTGTGPWLRQGMSRYWSTAAREFWEIAFDDNRESPGNTFILAAARAYEEVTDSYCANPRRAEVVERHRGRLFKYWNTAQKGGES
ncbi:type I-E CRISPR-associated protein Cse1/CasA [Nocardiopsis sp. CNT-189]|uniref:type I-E CRISPR-associated protein Cse1/CasA n=1 Tax=Nocardiopsis oceanisediminis TaxID=2816862 RepID=UPI003B301B34